MKIAFVTTYDSGDVSAWSGTPYFMLRAFERHGVGVQAVGPLTAAGMPLWNLKRFVYRSMLRRKYHWQREPGLLKAYAVQIRRTVSSLGVDAILSPSTMPLSLLRCDIPVVFWTDATFAGMVDFYDSFSNLCRETLLHGNRMEQCALDNSDLAIYSSHWAAESALSKYTVQPEKVRVVPFGANMESGLTRDEVQEHISKRADSRCELLFVGVDWERKGGGLALRLCELLNRNGLPAHITLVGSKPSGELPGYATSAGFISKATEAGRQRLRELYLRSHFLVLPTRADCVPVVLAEANSFAVPVLTTDVGGISSVVSKGENGRAFPLSAETAEYANFVQENAPGSREYLALALSSYDRYARDLNWEQAAGSVIGALKELRR
ncbi:MAG: glycosyltransferase family 4 protein [Burkholderiales bacterium]